MPDKHINQAAWGADRDALRRALAKGVSPSALNQGGSTPLHNLCLRGDNPEARVDCLHMLLEAGADIHLPCWQMRTPLYYATTCGNADVIAALIKAGADVNRGDKNGETPLHLVCFLYDVGPALLLLRHGAAATVNARDIWGRTPLDYAIRNSTLDSRHRRFLPILLRAGAALPAGTDNAYIQKVIAAGGFRIYERTHLATLTAFTSKLDLPARPARCVVEYAFHAGDY